MTIDDLAVATQKEFQSVREEMKEMRNEIIGEIIKVLGGAIERHDLHISAFASRASDDIANLQEITQEHDGRLRVLEKGK